LSRQGNVRLDQGDVAEARKKHEAAMTLRRQIGEKGAVAESQLALAQIDLQEDAPLWAEAPARAAIEQFRAEGRTDDEASGLALLARSLLAQGRNAEAMEASARAENLASKSNNGSLRLTVAITTASIRAAAGETAKAAKDLAGVAAEARRSGLTPLEFEARLALGEIELNAGDFQAARNQLTQLGRDAVRKGYKHIADRAAAALARIPQTPGVRSGA
jgi:ATP/maltotriose-dependent transcriptional regulator MalT